jgi:uncharacterized membrane protein
MGRSIKICLALAIAFAALGLMFSAVSTFDFIAQLDRQVHAVTCSFVPGLGGGGPADSSGCYAVMMSPYSSLLRDVMWGGVPIALLSLGVFAYLVFLGFSLLVLPDRGRPVYLGYAVAAALLPAIVSVVYWYISVALIGTVCKVCIGIYVGSFGSLAASVTGLILSLRSPRPPRSQEPHRLPLAWYGRSFGLGVLFVAMPLGAFLALRPTYTDEMSRCGELLHKEDKYGIRVKVNNVPGGIPAVELVDPLCPACNAFHNRLKASGLADRLQLEAIMFPLDDKCNWMVDQALHPGACTMAEAVLCAGDAGNEVMTWSLENQEDLRALAQKDPALLNARVVERFPAVAGCIGKNTVRSKINKSLRWISSNSTSVMTPQLFVDGVKLCDEDTDLGLEFSLTRMLSHQQTQTGAARPAEAEGLGR